jgi:3-hydroxyisobutyrate dehydrogenase
MTTQFQNIGWIGTGSMGAPMVHRVAAHGFKVVAFNRTPSKAYALKAHGITVAKQLSEVVDFAEILVTVVGTPEDVRDIVYKTDGFWSRLGPGHIFVDMSTSDPHTAIEIDKTATANHCYALDAPMTGGVAGANAGSLNFMVGGEKEAFESILPLFECMGQKISYVGKAGSGQVAKICNQILFAGAAVGLAESLAFAEKCGVNTEELINIMSGGAADCWALKHLGPLMVSQDMTPFFKLDHFEKDLGIVLSESRRRKLSTPLTSLARELASRAKANSEFGCGVQAIRHAWKSFDDKQ